MKKSVIVFIALFLVLSLTLASCVNSKTSCSEMLDSVLNAKSITVKNNGDTVFMKEGNTIYWKYMYSYSKYDEYYFDKSSNGTAYVYCKEYGEGWVKEPMTNSEYLEYVEMISNAYGVEEDIKSLFEYVYDDFDSIMEATDDGYIMTDNSFDMVDNFTLSNDKSTLTATFKMYSDYYNVEFFSINSTEIDIPNYVINAPVGSVSLP